MISQLLKASMPFPTCLNVYKGSFQKHKINVTEEPVSDISHLFAKSPISTVDAPDVFDLFNIITSDVLERLELPEGLHRFF